MNYGFERMWTLSFLPLGFVVVMAGGLAFVGAYAVGATRGGRSALAYVRACSWALCLALLATVVFGVVEGQWALFVQWFGLTPMVEMALMSFMWLASMWLMATSYARGRVRQDQKGREALEADAIPAGGQQTGSEVRDA